MTRMRSEDGSVSAYFVVASIAVIPLFGLVVDGAGQVRALQEASHVADEAGRSAAQAINPDDAVRGFDFRMKAAGVDSAPQRAREYIEAQGMTPGPIIMSDDDLEITVTVRSTYSPIFLSAFGVGPMDVEADSTTQVHMTDLDGEEFTPRQSGTWP